MTTCAKKWERGKIGKKRVEWKNGEYLKKKKILDKKEHKGYIEKVWLIWKTEEIRRTSWG